MKNYTAGSDPVFSEKIKIVEITDPVHADNANAASKQLIENDLALKAMLEKKMEPEEGMGLSHNDYTDEDRDKLAGIDEGANCYRHPESHPASMIEQDSTHRFVSDAKQKEWDAIYAQAVAYADLLIASLINGAPDTLDTLGEIAGAMKENADVVTALQEAIGKKANEIELARVAFSGSYSDLADKPETLDGQDGTPAGFGTPTATIDANTGTPSVTVTASGPDTAKVFHFEFRNLKGNVGETGPTGQPGKDGDKGDKGDKGDTGATGPAGANGATGTRGSQWYRGTGITGTGTTATVFSGSGVSSALVNDMYLNTSTGAVYTCTTAGAASTAKWVYSGSIKGAAGATGAKGATGATGLQGLKGDKGDKGDTGATGPQGPKGADGQANVTFAAEKPSSLANGVICMVYE